MKLLFLLLGVLLISLTNLGQDAIVQRFPSMEHLDSLYRLQWNSSQYAGANAAAKAVYLSEKEKRIIYYLNLARLNPKLFADTYATGYKGSNDYRNNPAFDANEKTLIGYLQSLKPMPLLKPDSLIFIDADCQATIVGQKGNLNDGHNRKLTGCKAIPDYAENIDYGKHTALDVVMAWLNVR